MTLGLILSTVTADAAERLARIWVESRRAACVSALPGATSVYHWKGEIVEDTETVLLIKSAWDSPEQLAELLSSFAADHPYDEPEFLVFEPDEAAEGYAKWVVANVRPQAGHES